MKQDEQQINEEVKPIIEEKEWERPDFVFLPKGNHIYRQEGPYIVCKSCELTHAVYIGMKKIMVGQDENGPILKKRLIV
jgi:hypothetical protein